MATRTDLSGFLRYDKINVLSTLRSKLEKIKTEIPEARFVARWSDDKASGEAQIAEVRVVHPKPAGVDQMVDDLEAEIAAALGPNPAGRLFVLFYEVGHTVDPVLQMRRTLKPTANADDHDYERLKEQLRAAREGEQAAYGLLRDTITSQGITISNLAQSNAHLAANRAAASAAADAGSSGIWGLLGLGVGVAMLPHIKKRLGLPEHASFDQVIERALVLNDANLNKQLKQIAETQRPPAGVLTDDELAELEEQAEPEAPAEAQATAATPAPAPPPSVDDLIAHAKAHPDFLAKLMLKAKENPELLNAAISAAMGA